MSRKEVLCRRCGKEGGGWMGSCKEHRYLDGEFYDPKGPIQEALSVGRFRGNIFVHFAMFPTKEDLYKDSPRIKEIYNA
jgi:hypothetical protein